MSAIGRRRAILLAVSACLLSVPVWAGASDRQRTLAGVSAVLVDVAPLGDASGDHGPSTAAVRGAVEARLRAHGIRVVGQEERDVRRLPTLYVRAVVFPSRPGVVAYYVAVEVWQVAAVGQGPAATTAYVPAWSSQGYLGVTDGAQALAAHLGQALAQQLDQLVAAHAAVNPPR